MRRTRRISWVIVTACLGAALTGAAPASAVPPPNVRTMTALDVSPFGSVAVGAQRADFPAPSRAVVFELDGAHWTGRAVPGNGTSVLKAVDVSPTGEAFAAGERRVGATVQPLLVRWFAGASIRRIDTSALDSDQLNGVLALRNTTLAVGARTVNGRQRMSVVSFNVRTGVARQQPIASPGSINLLRGIDGLDAHDVWVVGRTGADFDMATFAAHWDGHRWSRVPTPGTANGYGSLDAVKVVAHDDVWAVGSNYDATGHDRTLVLHFNGTEWAVVPSPNLDAPVNELHAVTATATDVWVAGGYGGTHRSPLLLRSHAGQPWTQVTVPTYAGSDMTTSIADIALSGRKLRGVGYVETPTGSAELAVRRAPAGAWTRETVTGP
jgi:hypothetical protein